MICIGQPVFEKWLKKSGAETCRKDQLWNVNNQIASKISFGKGFMTTVLQTDCLAIGTALLSFIPSVENFVVLYPFSTELFLTTAVQ